MRNIKKFRALNNMNQTELSKRMGISRTWLCKLESDDYKELDESVVNQLCEVFNCSPIALYGIENFRYLPKTLKDFCYVIKLLTLLPGDEELKADLMDLVEKYGDN